MTNFFALEGTDLVGKSTTIKLVAEKLRSYDLNVVVTREPGGSPFAEKVRELFLGDEFTLDQMTQLLLVTAARRDHYVNVIGPALKEKNTVVITDRYLLSTLIYQNPDNCPLRQHQILNMHETVLPKHLFDMPTTILLTADKSVLGKRFMVRKQRDKMDGTLYDIESRQGRYIDSLSLVSPNNLIVNTNEAESGCTRHIDNIVSYILGKRT